MRLLLVLSFFLAVPLARGTFQATREEDFWRTTDVDLSFAKKFFNSENCQKSVELSRACSAGIRKGFRLLKIESDSSSLSDLKAQNLEGALSRVDEVASQSQAVMPKQMLYGAMVNEALQQFDAHARILPTEHSNALTASNIEEKIGMGFDFEVTLAGIFVRRVYSDTPAEKAGLKVNDKILAVNGEAVGAGIRAHVAFNALPSSPGQEVELAVERSGRARKIYVAQAPLYLRNDEVRFFSLQARTLALVEIRLFAHGVCHDVSNHLDFAQGQLAGVVLDLRNNPGGLMSEASCLMSLFAGQAQFVNQKGVPSLLPEEFHLPLKSFASRPSAESVRPARFPNLPLLVLVNGSSASASEMLAAALQDNSRAWVVGERTFGKGTTQLMFEWPNRSGLSLIHTISRFYRPSGSPIQLVGVTPDFVVPFRKQASMAERRVYREADLYPTALQQEPSVSWQNPRMNQVQGIQNCIRMRAADQDLSNWHQRTVGHEDYQKTFALAVLGCAT